MWRGGIINVKRVRYIKCVLMSCIFVLVGYTYWSTRVVCPLQLSPTRHLLWPYMGSVSTLFISFWSQPEIISFLTNDHIPRFTRYRWIDETSLHLYIQAWHGWWLWLIGTMHRYDMTALYRHNTRPNNPWNYCRKPKSFSYIFFLILLEVNKT